MSDMMRKLDYQIACNAELYKQAPGAVRPDGEPGCFTPVEMKLIDHAFANDDPPANVVRFVLEYRAMQQVAA